MTTPGGYDFNYLYGMADMSGNLYEAGTYDAVVESAEFGRTKDGSKGAWTIKFRTTSGPGAGRSPLTTTLSISPKKNDGSDNNAGLGIMFRQLAALGIPVPDPANPQVCVNGPAPFWIMGWSEQQVAQAMNGKPVTIGVTQEEWDGVTRNKIAQIRSPRPGAPTDWPRTQAPAAQQGFMQPPPGYGQPQQGFAPQGGFGEQPGQPQQPAYPQPQQAPQPWQQAQQPPQGSPYTQYPQVGAPGQPPAASPAGPAPQLPGAPPWAQPGVPGQGGMGEFTPQGQSYQPSFMQPPQQAPAQPQTPQQWQPPQAQQPAGPPQPPWGQQAPPQGQQAPQGPPPVPQPPWQGQPQQGYANGQGQPPQQPAQPEAPPAPPWAAQ
jgi:hypothetical protein